MAPEDKSLSRGSLIGDYLVIKNNGKTELLAHLREVIYGGGSGEGATTIAEAQPGLFIRNGPLRLCACTGLPLSTECHWPHTQRSGSALSTAGSTAPGLLSTHCIITTTVVDTVAYSEERKTTTVRKDIIDASPQRTRLRF